MKSVIVICNDRGGGELIKKIIKSYSKNIFLIVSGPCKEIFKNHKNIVEPKISTIIDLKQKYEDLEVIVGTGWGLFELNWIKKLKKNDINFSVCLDNWIFYKERFLCPLDGNYYWPNQIITTNKLAYKLAKQNIGQFVKNIDLIEITTDLLKLKKIDSIQRSCHFISQPLEESLNIERNNKFQRFTYPKYNQFDIFNKLLSDNKIRFNKIQKWVIYPHPSEELTSKKKWKEISNEKNNFLLEVKRFENIVFENDIYIGLNSSLLISLSKISNNVYSLCDYIKWKEKLPIKSIKYI